MIDPGHLRTRLSIQAPVETPDGQGGVTRSHAIIGGAWASIEASGVRASVDADAPGAVLVYRVIMRRGPDLRLQHRLVRGERIYRITSIRDDDTGLLDISAERWVE